jgi:transposase
VSAPERQRERVGSLQGARLARAARALRHGSPDERVLSGVLRRLGRRVQQLEVGWQNLDGELETIVTELVRELLEECGVGPVCAAQLVASSGDPARMQSEAAFAALAGTSPVDASSGRQRRHRVNRGGDRQLNRTLHVIALARVRHHHETAAYHERLPASAKTTREARRCVKRALARHFYRRLRANPALTT